MFNFKIKMLVFVIVVIGLVSMGPIYASEANSTNEVDSIINNGIEKQSDVLNKTNVTNTNNVSVVKSDGESSINAVAANRDIYYIAFLNCAKRVKTFVNDNGRLPNYVTYYDQNNEYNLSMPEFLYLLAKFTVNVHDSSSNRYITLTRSFSNPTAPSGVSINGQITEANYYAYAKSIVSFMDSNGRAPNYISTSLGNMQYQTVVYMYSLILDFVNTNDRLPNYVTVNIASSHSLNKYLPVYTGSSSVSSSLVSDKSSDSFLWSLIVSSLFGENLLFDDQVSVDSCTTLTE